MRCAVFGATGYVGARLIPELLAAGHHVRVLARNRAKLEDHSWYADVDVVEGDVSDPDTVGRALAGQDVLYYLVHSLLRADFVDFDARAAALVGEAAARAGLTRIVYLGGIAAPDQQLSDHLASRAEVGELLRGGGVPTVELRAAAIIGAGSASFEMLRYLAERLPVILAPSWLRTTIQPIAVSDALYYLVAAAELPPEVDRAFDIGGPDQFRYLEMIRKYAAIAGLWRHVVVPTPLISPRLSSQAVDIITPMPRALTQSLMESLRNDMVCTERDIARHIPDPPDGLTHYERAVELALARVRGSDATTPWSDGDEHRPSDPLPTDPSWAGGSLYEHQRNRSTSADAGTVWRVLESLRGEHGLYAFPLTWSARGWISDAVGHLGPTIDNARDDGLRTGESLDWWWVEHVDAPRRLRLRSQAIFPGNLWVELSLDPSDGGGTVYRQRVIFQPQGLAGLAFWTMSAPFLPVVLGGIARHITSAAERLARARV